MLSGLIMQWDADLWSSRLSTLEAKEAALAADVERSVCRVFFRMQTGATHSVTRLQAVPMLSEEWEKQQQQLHPLLPRLRICRPVWIK